MGGDKDERVLRSDRRLAARLLSKRPGLFVEEKEEVLERVLHAIARDPGKRERGMRTGRLGWAVAAFVLLLLAVPLTWWWSRGPEPEEFLSRGAPGSPFGFSLACAGKVGACSRGAKLLFRLQVPEGRPYFSAFARGPEAAVVWYFPGSGGEKSIDTSGCLRDGFLDVGIELGEEHPPGDYLVLGMFSSVSLEKQRIRAVFERGEENDTSLFVLASVIFSVESP
jgi:hypothetical protein